MARKPQPKKKIDIKRLTHDDVPASARLVNEVRNEVSAEVESLRHDVMARFVETDGKIEKLDHKVDSLEHRIDSLEHKMISQFQQVLAITHRTQVLMEQQRSENKIVLDGIKMVMDRIDRHEVEFHHKSP